MSPYIVTVCCCQTSFYLSKTKLCIMLKLRQLAFSSPLLQHDMSVSFFPAGAKPKLSLQHFPGIIALFLCSLPASANKDTTCNLYLGDETLPHQTSTTMSLGTKMNQQWFCQLSVSNSDLLRLSSIQLSFASCDYRLGSDPGVLSPRSERYNLTGERKAK